MKELPIGIQDFPTLIDGGFAYVDKTEQIYRLIKKGVAYFLSRPRRFGKSLLISSLASLFKGERHLFEGTWIDQADYQWAKHPVIELDFSRLASESAQALLDSLDEYLRLVGRDLGVELPTGRKPDATLADLVGHLHKRQKVVILIDEYDKPLVKHLNDPALTRANRLALHDFFAMIKSLQGQLRMVFITGVSRFSKISLFSGMNNLNDISIDDDYATLIGLTESEIETALAQHVKQVSQQKELDVSEIINQMREWYNGYLFGYRSTTDRVFNPWSVLKYLSSGIRKNYWFDTATPTFAVELIKERGYPLVRFEEGIKAGHELDGNHDVETIDLPTLLFQTGYLTIDYYDEGSNSYYLKLPNEEVRRSLLEHLLKSYADGEPWKTEEFLSKLQRALDEGNLTHFFEGFNQLLASIPYPLQIPHESYYHSLIYLFVRTLGFASDAEVMTSRGRIDLVVSASEVTYLFEFKIDSSAKKALKQIRASEYPHRFEAGGQELILVGANFSSKKRQIDDWSQESHKGPERGSLA